MKNNARSFSCLQLLVLLCISSSIQSAASSQLKARRFLSTNAKALTSSAAMRHHDNNGEDPKPTPQPTKSYREKIAANAQVLWSARSKIPDFISQLIGMVWVLLLGSVPIVVYKIGNKQVTMTGISLSVLMWFALFGGLFLFTHIIQFESPHFDEVRSLTIIECTYFMTQVITTVGYGDITPAYPRGELFVGLYVALSFFVIALLVSQVQNIVVNKIADYKEEVQAKVLSKVSDELRRAQSVSKVDDFGFKPKKPSAKDLIASTAGFLTIAGIWILFYHFFPGEDKTWNDAVYMSLITLTTVGFGAVTPNTEGGMIFGSFFMFFGTVALVTVVTNFSTFVLEYEEWETWDEKKYKRDLLELCKKGSGGASEIDEIDFITFALTQKNLVTQDQVDDIRSAFASISAGKTASVEDLGRLGGLDPESVSRDGDGDGEKV